MIKFGETQYISDRLLHQPLLQNLIDHIDVKLSHKDDVAKNMMLDLIEKVIKSFLIELYIQSNYLIIFIRLLKKKQWS